MSAKKRGKARLAELEKMIRAKDVQLSYDKLQFAGLRLKSGMCWFKGRYYLFVDKLKPLGERIELLETALEELKEIEEQGGLPLDAVEDGHEPR